MSHLAHYLTCTLQLFTTTFFITQFYRHNLINILYSVILLIFISMSMFLKQIISNYALMHSDLRKYRFDLIWSWFAFSHIN